MRFPITRGQSNGGDERHESCASCVFWNPWFNPRENSGPVVEALNVFLGKKSEGGRGECRRHAPTGSNRWHWTDGKDWCGDYEQRSANEPTPQEE